MTHKSRRYRMPVRTISIIATLLFAVSLAGCPPVGPPVPPREYDPALLGDWAGSFYEPTTGKTYTIRMEFTEREFEIRLEKFNQLLWAGEYVVNLDTSPNEIDLFVDYAANQYGIVRSVEQLYLGLYVLEGEDIVFSLGPLDGERPPSIDEGAYVFEGTFDDSRFAYPPGYVEGEFYPEPSQPAR